MMDGTERYGTREEIKDFIYQVAKKKATCPACQKGLLKGNVDTENKITDETATMHDLYVSQFDLLNPTFNVWCDSCGFKNQFKEQGVD